MNHQPIHSKGFTLLELMVVLMILGLVSAVALPNLSQAFDRLQARLAEDRVIEEINRLPERAYLAKSELILLNQTTSRSSGSDNPGQQAIKLDLPQGWSIKTAGIVYRANGICEGGLLSVRFEGEAVWTGELIPPFCQLVPEVSS